MTQQNTPSPSDIAAMRASMDTYMEQLIIQRGLVQFFQAVSQYTNTHLLGSNDMFVRGTCGHRYITKYVNRADLLAKLGRACPKCLPREKESLRPKTEPAPWLNNKETW